MRYSKEIGIVLDDTLKKSNYTLPSFDEQASLANLTTLKIPTSVNKFAVSFPKFTYHSIMVANEIHFSLSCRQQLQ